MFGVLFYLFLVLFISGRYYSDAAIFENLQDLEEKDFEQQQARKQGKCSSTMLVLCAFFP
jgi:hypothetical protein